MELTFPADKVVYHPPDFGTSLLIGLVTFPRAIPKNVKDAGLLLQDSRKDPTGMVRAIERDKKYRY